MAIDTVTGLKSRNMMSGLVSGMDTASLVDSMLAGTKSKLEAQNAAKQQLIWKQEIYRDIISKANNFQSEFLSYSSTKGINLLSSGFYNSMITTSSSSAVKVLASNSNAPSDMTVNVIEMATAFKAKSNTTVSGALRGMADVSKLADGQIYTLDVSLDGVKKTIEFKGVNDAGQSAADNMQKTLDNLNQSLSYVFGTTVKATQSGGNINIDSTNATHTISVSATPSSEETGAPKDALALLGMTSGASNKLNLNSRIGDASFVNGLMGDKFEFSINGKKFTASARDTVNDVIGMINSSDANVRLSYSASEDRFTIESTLFGDISDIQIEQSSGNLLSVLLGLGSGSGAGSRDLKTDAILADHAIDDTLLDAILDTTKTSNHMFTLNVNGTNYTMGIKANPDGTPYTRAQFIDAMNKSLEERFGKDADGNANISLFLNGDMVSINSADGYKVAMADTSDWNIMDALGFLKEQNQNVSLSTTLNQLGISGSLNVGGTTIMADGSWTMETLVNKLNEAGVGQFSFDEAGGVLSVKDVTGANVLIESADTNGNAMMNKLFGSTSLSFNTTGTDMTKTAGSNAKLEINGVAVERNSNQFTENGVTIQIMEKTSGAIHLTSERNTDKIVSGIKDFVEEYNKLIDDINGKLHEKAYYRDYPPLTSDQRKAMSESEIKNWEEKAKQGLIRSDNDISSFLSEMRSAFYKEVDRAGLAIYDIGIETSDNYKDYGKLVIDEDKLKDAVANHLPQIQKLFIDPESGPDGDKQQGIMRWFNDALKNAVNMSSGSPGTLVRTAGVAGMTTETMNYMYNQLKDINERIKTLQNKYQTEYNRYWTQFTSMEKMISNMNNQSSWVAQQFSS